MNLWRLIAMSGEMRWQDWITAALGVILFITPFVFGDTSQTAAAWTAYVGGVLLFVLGVGSLLLRWNNTVEYLPLIVGVALFLAPWVLGFSGITAMAWSAWIIGVVAVISAGYALLAGGNLTGRRSATAH
jgi:VIT1/CCC1 family predicted Fe2+/Mn2+ transporter